MCCPTLIPHCITAHPLVLKQNPPLAGQLNGLLIAIPPSASSLLRTTFISLPSNPRTVRALLAFVKKQIPPFGRVTFLHKRNRRPLICPSVPLCIERATLITFSNRRRGPQRQAGRAAS